VTDCAVHLVQFSMEHKPVRSVCVCVYGVVGGGVVCLKCVMYLM